MTGIHWFPVKDGDARAFGLMRRHYTFRQYADGRRNNLANPNRHLFVGPGEKIVLMTSSCDALFVWRRFIDHSGAKVIHCAVFRNEGEVMSSALIREAEEVAWARWPGETLYTYVDPTKIRSRNPGFCFKVAGWVVDSSYRGKQLIRLLKTYDQH